MTTDNRTNEPSGAMVEAAAKALHETRNPWFGAYGDWSAAGVEIKQAFRESARAALVAAQCAARPVNGFDTTAERVKTGADSLHVAPVLPSSAAPQAEPYDHCCQHHKCPGGSLCCCASEQRMRDCWNQWREEIAGDSKQAFRDGYQAGHNDPAPWLAATVLPSSGVEEDKLAEVIRSVTRPFVTGRWLDDATLRSAARAVAAWLKGQGR